MLVKYLVLQFWRTARRGKKHEMKSFWFGKLGQKHSLSDHPFLLLTWIAIDPFSVGGAQVTTPLFE